MRETTMPAVIAALELLADDGILLIASLCSEKSIAEILFNEGFIKAYEEIENENQGIIRISLKYTEKGKKVISGLRRISKPGLRIYASKDELPKVLNGLGIALISTSKGIMTDKEARKQKLGGEVMAYIW